MTMIRANVHEIKARLSEYLDRAESGETIVVCRRNVPIAEIRAIATAPTKPRPIGIAPGLKVRKSFFDPLPDDLIGAFEGRD